MYIRNPCFFEEEKAPAGMYKTNPDFFEESKAPAGMYKTKLNFFRKNCGHVQDETGLFGRKRSPDETIFSG